MQFSYLRKSTLLGTIRPQRVHYLERLGVIGDSLAFQADYFEKTSVGQTFEIKLLGKVGYFTKDPKNLEAMLSTRFEDWGLGSRRPGLFPMIGESIFTQESGWADLETFSRATVSPVCANTIPRCEVFDGPVNGLLAWSLLL
ncbi:hypothetical protein M430DRAFT_23348 [Amorphotheca resinae ATCC 22711]|uniref:Uncharacterized protein n=1 Tax=Amorphotheca resinae ATCC 22711 TaxID=857342 RepID=A0A2T3ANZ7_AMORE|nr:hypothetical protein M430DRAFT_23348 [Amorphotheca resinae ATCC 22711]PSS06649.1 hypothetical protein M430DRAFT_23348 [Amorphotheca resinae ATCC 22711]